MKILAEKIVTRFGITFTAVLTEGQVNDCAVYTMCGMCNPYDVAHHGEKMGYGDRTALFDLPEGKHWRI